MNNLSFDLYVMFFFGTLGWIMKKFGYEPAPLILAYILGPLMENNLRQSLLISQGKFMIFLTRPIAAVALGIACLLLLSNLLPFLKKRRQVYEQFKSEE
jgi:putative tricarboxylic transport membrane protein